jgi:hypothetical protein
LKRIKLENVNKLDGEPFRIPDREGSKPREVNVIDLLRVMMRVIPKATMADGEQAWGLYAAFAAAKGKTVLELEDEPYKWALNVVETVGPMLFNTDSYMIKLAMENLKEEKKEAKD